MQRRSSWAASLRPGTSLTRLLRVAECIVWVASHAVDLCDSTMARMPGLLAREHPDYNFVLAACYTLATLASAAGASRVPQRLLT